MSVGEACHSYRNPADIKSLGGDRTHQTAGSSEPPPVWTMTAAPHRTGSKLIMNGYARQQSSESRSIEGNGGTPTKRKNDDSPGSHTRAKRNRYISIAWYESYWLLHLWRLANDR